MWLVIDGPAVQTGRGSRPTRRVERGGDVSVGPFRPPRREGRDRMRCKALTLGKFAVCSGRYFPRSDAYG